MGESNLLEKQGKGGGIKVRGKNEKRNDRARLNPGLNGVLLGQKRKGKNRISGGRSQLGRQRTTCIQTTEKGLGQEHISQRKRTACGLGKGGDNWIRITVQLR